MVNEIHPNKCQLIKTSHSEMWPSSQYDLAGSKLQVVVPNLSLENNIRMTGKELNYKLISVKIILGYIDDEILRKY